MSFDQFWLVYPRRVAKFRARKAYDKMVKAGNGDRDIYEGARRYAEERRGQEMQYTKHPATWLNDGCWLDDQGANGGDNGQRDQLGAFDRIQTQLEGSHDQQAAKGAFRIVSSKKE